MHISYNRGDSKNVTMKNIRLETGLIYFMENS